MTPDSVASPRNRRSEQDRPERAERGVRRPAMAARARPDVLADGRHNAADRGIIWLLSLTYVIVLPVLTAGIVAAVASPLVAWLATHGVPRGIGSALILLALIALGVGVVLVVVGGITGETGDVTARLADAKDTIAGWLNDLGVDPSRSAEATQDASAATGDTSRRCSTAWPEAAASFPRPSSSLR